MTHRSRLVLVTMLLFVAVQTTGCGGFQASRSFSPMDFMMPRGIKHRPDPADPALPRDVTSAPRPEPATLLAVLEG